jgi:hypothetical protein
VCPWLSTADLCVAALQILEDRVSSFFFESEVDSDTQSYQRRKRIMSLRFPCPRCQRNTEWSGNHVVGGTSRCTGCDILSTSSMLPCPGCEKTGFLYPTRCSTCSQFPAQVFLVVPGTTLTLSNGTSVTGAASGMELLWLLVIIFTWVGRLET